MDSTSTRQTIELRDAKIYECDEKRYLGSGTASKRSVSRRLDLRFSMFYDVFNNVEYTLAGGGLFLFR